MNVVEYTKELVSHPSVSVQSNAAISDHIQQTLEDRGWQTERVDYHDAEGVLKVNVLGKKGPGEGGVAFFGHTDTVPAENWAFDSPFQPFEKDGRLYGRGACDMKGPVACALAAAERFDAASLRRPIYLICTADEEVHYIGAKVVAERSRMFQEEITKAHGIICEPTRLEVVYAHKGTVGIRAVAHGRAAHSATDAGLNANLKIIPFLWEMKKIHDELQSDPAWRNEEFDPPTPGWNIGVNDHNPVLNITAPESTATIYFRPMPGQDNQRVLDRVRRAAGENDLDLEIRQTGEPPYTPPDSPIVREVLEATGRITPRTVSYGTDAVVFGRHMPLVVFGPGDIAQAHTIDEWIELEQLEQGVELNCRLIERFCL